MPSPPLRTGTRSLGTVLGAIALFALPVAAQQPPEFSPTAGFSRWVDAVLGALFTLLVGGGLIALAPEFTGRTTDRVLEEPGEAFLYGLGIFLAAIVLVVLLAITVVGIVLAVPLLVVLAVLGQVGFLATGRAVVDGWGAVLLVAIVVSALSSGVPYLGGLVGFVIACTGLGAWYLDFRDDGANAGVAGPGIDPVSGETTGADPSGETDEGTREADDDPGDAWTAGIDDEHHGN